MKKKPFNDIVVTAKVKGGLVRENVFGNKTFTQMGINVEAINGVVYLTGSLETQEQLAKTMAVIKSVNGVKEIQSKLKVGTQ